MIRVDLYALQFSLAKLMLMKLFNCILILLLIFTSCQRQTKNSFLEPVNWEEKRASVERINQLKKESTYLSVYSEIYQFSDRQTYDLTATISMRNISSVDTVFIMKADYYNTHGDLIRSYIQKPVYIKPMETIEVVIGQEDKEGGTGANFIFDWAVKENTHEPIFEAVMISTSGQQGLSFTTQGIKR